MERPQLFETSIVIVAAAAVSMPLVAIHIDAVCSITARCCFFSCSVPRTWPFTTNTVSISVYWKDCSTKL